MDLRHPKPPKRYKNHQILLNIGVVMAKVSSGPPPMQKDPPQGGPGVQKFGPLHFHTLWPKTNRNMQ